MSSIQEQDRWLIANGYEPIPLDGKAAVATNWQAGPIDVERAVALREVYPHAPNTGLRTGATLSGIDIDIFNRDLVREVCSLAERMLGATKLKRFGSKGLMLCYRASEPSRKIVIVADEKDGETPKIEILGQGQQFAAFGIHPTTKKPFEWIEKDEFDEPYTPLNVPLAALPCVSPEALRKFADACADLLAGNGYSNPRVRANTAADRIAKTTDVPEDHPNSIKEAEVYLKNIASRGQKFVEGERGDVIYKLAAAIRDRYNISKDRLITMLEDHWYPHCIEGMEPDEFRSHALHATRYMQNEPGARALPPASEAFAAALDKLPADFEAGEATIPASVGLMRIEIGGNYDKPLPPAITYNDEDEIKPAPLVELIPDWLEKGLTTFFEGPAATQKSRVALYDAVCLANELPPYGKDVLERTQTIYLNYENPRDEMERRHEAAVSYLRRSHAKVSKEGICFHHLREHLGMQLLVVNKEGIFISAAGRSILQQLANNASAGNHTLLILDGLTQSIEFNDNMRNDDTTAMKLISVIESWCREYDCSIYALHHPSRGAERSNASGSYATAWSTAPRSLQTFKKILSPNAGGGAKAKITEETPAKDIWAQRRIQKRSNGVEGLRMWYEIESYANSAVLLPQHPRKRIKLQTGDAQPDPGPELEDDNDF